MTGSTPSLAAIGPAREQLILSSKTQTLGGLKVTGLDTTDGFKFNLEDGGWMLIRFSGTEPIIRVYTETTHKESVQAILEDGLRVVGIKVSGFTGCRTYF